MFINYFSQNLQQDLTLEYTVKKNWVEIHCLNITNKMLQTHQKKK